MSLRFKYACWGGASIAAFLAIVNGCSSSDGDAEKETESAPDASLDGAIDAAPRDGSDADSEASTRIDASAPSIKCANEPCIVDISAGRGNVCALTSEGIVYCWGDNPSGEVSHPAVGSDAGAGEEPAFVPESVPAPRRILAGVRSIAAGTASTCAILTDGTVKCWGGIKESCAPSAEPTTIEGLPPMRSLATSSSATCGVTEDHDLWCWGYGSGGILAREGAETGFTACVGTQYAPARADLVAHKMKNVALSWAGVQAVDESDHLWSWGAKAAIGRASSVDTDTIPFQVPMLEAVSSVSLGSNGAVFLPGYGDVNACAVANGRVHCWGTEHHDPRIVALPEGVYASQVATQVSYVSPRATRHACARTLDGSVYCWGNNQLGQLGNGSVDDQPVVPARVEALKGAAAKVVVTNIASCALIESGEVQCWGGNLQGQLGLGTVDNFPHVQPTPASLP
jgi:alpha-tubulin suppressor-like RCC1 family protein